jgi:hypothetical protein
MPVAASESDENALLRAFGLEPKSDSFWGKVETITDEVCKKVFLV